MSDEPHEPDSLDIVPSRALEDALKMVNADPEAFQKAFIILLDDSPGRYSTRFFNSGMKMSECIGLLAIMQDRLHRIMDEPDGGEEAGG